MREQTDENYQWFLEHRSALLVTNRGQHALLHDKAVTGFFSSSLDAIKVGLTKFGEGNFSVEPVDDFVEDLGFYSHVGSALRA